MAKVKIYIPTRNAMQSGKANTAKWLLEYKPESKKIIDNLIGWQGSTDMKQEIKLYFNSKESAIDYAQKNNLEFEVKEPKTALIKPKSYAENITG